MLHWEITAVLLSSTQTYINALCELKVEFLNVKPRGTVHDVTTKLLGANKYRKFSYYQSANMVENIHYINPLKAELNPICHLLALLGGATIVVVSRLRVNHAFNKIQ
jgi:hypothetical protein